MAAKGNGKATNGSGGTASGPATNGKSYPIEDHTYDVVVVGAGAAGANDHHVVSVVFDRIGFSVGGGPTCSSATTVGGLAVTLISHGLHSR